MVRKIQTYRSKKNGNVTHRVCISPNMLKALEWDLDEKISIMVDVDGDGDIVIIIKRLEDIK
jgi:hypothetical protein